MANHHYHHQLKFKFFYNPDFNISIFSKKLQNSSDCRKVISKCSNRVFRNSGIDQIEVQKTWSYNSKERTKMHLGDPVEVLRKPIYALDKTADLIFIPMYKKIRTEITAFQCSPTQTTYIWDIYIIVQQKAFPHLRTTLLSGTLLNLQLNFIGRLWDMFNFFPSRSLPHWRFLHLSLIPYTWLFLTIVC